ncbi:MAG: hypothetical protein CL489_06065 [Acidobacteria bacterium]|nr:hypothetical protein [Acidobacteriota bacterium]|tara:strand:+ start:5148 stop:5861 length:714 start_codon:yes stop_codon:yes gene_type:complete
MKEILDSLSLIGLFVLSIVTIMHFVQLDNRGEWMRQVQENFDYGQRCSLHDLKQTIKANNLIEPDFAPRPPVPEPFWRETTTSAKSDTCPHCNVPMRFFDCVGTVRAWRIIIAHSLISAMYLGIAFFRFLPAGMEARTQTERVVWYSLAFIFPFCWAAGYGTTILAGWFPALAYFLKESACYVDAAFCVTFLWSTRNQNLVSVTVDSFRDEIEDIVNNEDSDLSHGDRIQQIRDSLQ